MPYYLFTYHAFGSWMPDRKQGYVRRGQGILAPDHVMAERYRAAMTQGVVEFNSAIQLAIIDILLESRAKQRFELYFVATEISHAHVLVGWRNSRTWLRLRSTIKSSMTRYLNREFERQEWFVEGGSRKRVKDRKHFDHLVMRYLPKHAGWKWSPERGRHR